MDVQYFTLNLIEPELPLLKRGEESRMNKYDEQA
jgi:hypothetical protein